MCFRFWGLCPKTRYWGYLAPGLIEDFIPRPCTGFLPLQDTGDFVPKPFIVKSKQLLNLHSAITQHVTWTNEY